MPNIVFLLKNGLRFYDSFSQLLACFNNYISNEVIDLDTAYMVRVLVFCRDNNIPFLLTNTEMSQLMEHICTI